MTTQEALLADIIAKPDDDLPRLVFADWLDENGESDRASFIRVQIAAARRVSAIDAPGVCDNFDRIGVAECHCGYCKLTDLAFSLQRRLPLTPGISAKYTRGFISEAGCTLENWVAHGPALVRSHPVERVVPTDREPHVAQVNGQNAYYWSRPSWGPMADVLPQDVYDLLPDLELSSDGLSMKGFHTREDAFSALSAALIAWAKSQPI